MTTTSFPIAFRLTPSISCLLVAMDVSGDCRLCLCADRDDAPGNAGQLCLPCDCRSPVHLGCVSEWQQAEAEARSQGWYEASDFTELGSRHRDSDKGNPVF